MPIREPRFPNVYHKINRKYVNNSWNIGRGHETKPTNSFFRNSLNLKELGLKPKEKIHFFCAYSGEWAKALKETGMYVDVSDMSPTQLDRLKKLGFDRVIDMPAQLHNLVPEYYDWSISFEPIPLFHNKTIEHTLRRGALNKKGIKIIMGSAFVNTEYLDPLKRFAKKYGLTIDSQVTNIDNDLSTTIYIITLKTNPLARRKAELDIYVEKALINYNVLNKQTIIALAKYLGTSFDAIVASLKRLGHENLQLPKNYKPTNEI
jgi:hypothetical protein